VLAAVWLGGIALLALNIESLRRSSLRLREDLSATRTDLETFRRGLGDEIERQLEVWSLTPSEKQVAQLLLKGLGHREIAEIRDTSEKTVRQQAARVYQKAQVSGRAELSAFFLEDLLLPAGSERPAQGSAETSA
jgi:DNA-binding CsgD family transcriptional regulator